MLAHSQAPAAVVLPSTLADTPAAATPASACRPSGDSCLAQFVYLTSFLITHSEVPHTAVT